MDMTDGYYDVLCSAVHPFDSDVNASPLRARLLKQEICFYQPDA